MSGQTILISGAGIAGCTLAYWLRERGFTPLLIEQAPHFRQGGYMIDFWGIGFDVAERMRLIPALRTKSYFMNEVEFVGEDDTQRSTFGGEAFERVLGDRFFSIRRDDLANTLYSSIQNDVETLFGTTISTLNQDAERVEVTFNSGESRVVDLVIGADGLGSGVRKQVFGPRNEFENYLHCYAASFATEGFRNARSIPMSASRRRAGKLAGIRCVTTGRPFSSYSRRKSNRRSWRMTLRPRNRLCARRFRTSHGSSGLKSKSVSIDAPISILMLSARSRSQAGLKAESLW